MFRKISRFFFLSVFFVSFVNCVSAKVVDKTLAAVNGEAIMSSEFDDIITPILEQFKKGVPPSEQTPEKIMDLKKRVLDQMVDDRLAKQEAKKRNIKVAKREVEQGINQIKQRFPSEEAFNAELKKGNINMSQFEKRIEEQLMVMKLMDQEIKSKTKIPTEEEMKDFYSKIQKKMNGKNLGLDKKSEDEVDSLAKLFKRAGAEKVRARHILIRADKNATQKEKAEALKKISGIKKEIDDGADFNELAKKYSEDPGTKDAGGDLGFFSYEDMVPEFAKAAFATEVGKISGVISTDFGYHVIKIEEKKASRKLTYEDLKNDIQDYLFQKAAQKKYETWMQEIRAKASITVNPVE
jgi:parvulin-like peptidyl-prolyl isomerase